MERSKAISKIRIRNLNYSQQNSLKNVNRLSGIGSHFRLSIKRIYKLMILLTVSRFYQIKNNFWMYSIVYDKSILTVLAMLHFVWFAFIVWCWHISSIK